METVVAVLLVIAVVITSVDKSEREVSNTIYCVAAKCEVQVNEEDIVIDDNAPGDGAGADRADSTDNVGAADNTR